MPLHCCLKSYHRSLHRVQLNNDDHWWLWWWLWWCCWWWLWSLMMIMMMTVARQVIIELCSGFSAMSDHCELSSQCNGNGNVYILCVQCAHNVHILQCSGKMQLEESALGCKCIPSYCPLFLIIPLQFIQRFKTNSNFHWDLQWVQKTMINICLWYTYDAHRPSLQWRGTRLQSFVKCNLLNTFLKMDDGVTNLCCFGVIRYH